MYNQVTIWMFFICISNVIADPQIEIDLGDMPLFPSSKVPQDGLSPQQTIMRRKIVQYHNFFRTKVRPTASNKLLMTWHLLAAQQAQNYANKCIFGKHNDPSDRSVPLLGKCGQNLYADTQKTSWFYAIKSWFLEYKNFTYGAPVTNFKAVGHYTQMTWATSHKVGCGIAHCKGGPWGQFYNYVCHYCPTGNIQGIIQYPYKTGAKCADCSNQCILGSLCTNTCPVVNVFSNCDELALQYDVCSQGICNATCACGSKQLYKNHPW